MSEHKRWYWEEKAAVEAAIKEKCLPEFLEERWLSTTNEIEKIWSE